jgi:hypothetical protein
MPAAAAMAAARCHPVTPPIRMKSGMTTSQALLVCGGWGRQCVNAMQPASNATLAESPIDILLWEFPLNSHFEDAAAAER